MQKDVLFTCSSCDAQFVRWAGRCLECGQWGTIREETRNPSHSTGHGKIQETKIQEHAPAETRVLTDIQTDIKRILTNIGELDRVLGGGIVPGSLILLGGEPGIGKSTLALQLATAVPNTLYISGEESVEQISMRARRLFPHVIPAKAGIQTNDEQMDSRFRGNDNGASGSLSLANETNADSICATITQSKPALAIIDSIQTIYSEDVAGEPGNPNQIRACAAKLLDTAKSNNIATVIIGHVTKDGNVAGPKMLEHLVDTVLYFEGDMHHNLRILRATKNRFGSTDEVGIFDMTETGLTEVKNPSEYLLAERGENMPGSVVTCLLEGTRPMLVEIQALVNKTVFGYPQRKASGFDSNRLNLLIAVLQRRAGLNLAQYDIHVNVVGGLRADEPAADLAVCLAIASAYKDKALGADLVAFGEVGLGGEVRSVRQLERRIKECEQLGMKRVITRLRASVATAGLKAIDVKNIGELIRQT